jgi:hypothetical protein
MHHGTESTDPLSPPAVGRRGFLATTMMMPILGAAPTVNATTDDPLALAAAEFHACVVRMRDLYPEYDRLYDRTGFSRFLRHTWTPAHRRMCRAQERLLALTREAGIGAITIRGLTFSDWRDLLHEMGDEKPQELSVIDATAVVDLDRLGEPAAEPTRRFDLASRKGVVLTHDEGPLITPDDAIRTATRAIACKFGEYRVAVDGCDLLIKEGEHLLAEVLMTEPMKSKVVRYA